MSKQIEESLAPIVYSQLQDQLPELFEYLIGFQLIEEKNNGNKCLGMLAFNIKNRHYYMPVFYLNGFLKPLVILYNYEKGVFSPATKDTIGMLSKSNTGLDAELVNRSDFRTAVSTPNLERIALQPMFSKMSSPKFPNVEPILSKMEKSAFYEVLMKDREILRKIAEDYPFLIEDKLSKKEDSGKISFFDKPSQNLTEEENTAIFTGNIVVEDTRKNTNRILEVPDSMEYNNPVLAGKYKIINDEYKFVEKWILPRPCGISYVIDCNDFSCSEVDNKTLFGLMIEPDIDNLYSSMVSLSKVEKGKKYIVFNYKRKYTDMFEYCDCTPIKMNPHTSDEIFKRSDGVWYISSDCVALLVTTGCFCPGSIDDLLEKLHKFGADEILLEKKAGYFNYRYKSDNYTLPYNEAFKKLALDHNLGVDTVDSMLKNSGRYIVKNAADFPTTEPTYEIHQEPTNYRASERTPDIEFKRSIENDRQFAGKAMKAGNKSIFDSALLGILGKNQNDVERVKSLIPIINQAVHALGTILFAIWWNPESYTTDFSTDELYELEQSTLTTFKELGNIVIKLIMRKKLYGETQ